MCFAIKPGQHCLLLLLNGAKLGNMENCRRGLLISNPSPSTSASAVRNVTFTQLPDHRESKQTDAASLVDGSRSICFRQRYSFCLIRHNDTTWARASPGVLLRPSGAREGSQGDYTTSSSRYLIAKSTKGEQAELVVAGIVCARSHPKEKERFGVTLRIGECGVGVGKRHDLAELALRGYRRFGEVCVSCRRRL